MRLEGFEPTNPLLERKKAAHSSDSVAFVIGPNLFGIQNECEEEMSGVCNSNEMKRVYKI
jgi:hypothetical protein